MQREADSAAFEVYVVGQFHSSSSSSGAQILADFMRVAHAQVLFQCYSMTSLTLFAGLVIFVWVRSQDGWGPARSREGKTGWHKAIGEQAEDME